MTGEDNPWAPTETAQQVTRPVAGASWPGAPWPGAPGPATVAMQAGRPVRVPRWGLPSAIAAVLAAIALPGVVTLPALIGPGGVPVQAPPSGLVPLSTSLLLLALLAQWLPMAGIPLLVSVLRGNGPRLDFGLSIARRDLAPGILGGLVAVGLALIVALLTFLVYGEFQSSAEQLLGLLERGPYLIIAIIVGVVIAAPLVEEICFRGLLWGALAKRGLSPWWATVISAAAFAALHLEPVRFILLFGTGLVLGYLRQRTGRLGPPIIAHAVNNGIAALGLIAAV
ncbi:MAG: CPBP family intramembrane metalloprotease [Actinomycetales bacterium]|nr:CPBP family intramembrane metalloprotease [Actinomycetales bacterium]